MIFRNDGQRFNYIVTRDLNLSTDSKPVFEETFDNGPLERYERSVIYGYLLNFLVGSNPGSIISFAIMNIMLSINNAAVNLIILQFLLNITINIKYNRDLIINVV